MTEESQQGPSKPLIDSAKRMPMRNLLALVAVQAVGLAVILSVSWLLEGDLSIVATLLVPPLVSFVLIVAQPQLPSSRPLRVLGAYALTGFLGICLSILPWPATILGVMAGATALFFFYLFGVFHAPHLPCPLPRSWPAMSWQMSLRPMAS
ncbi:MAG: hypothetical protein O2943_04230 [Actinomycetota bacterium]|nr:hypothetical protein [Actinomycetota bacterium]